MIRFGLSAMPEPHFAAAALPLFEEGRIDALEWSFDMGWGPAGIPDWLDELTQFYSTEGWLLGHGVSYSLMGAEGRHDAWLERLAVEVQQRSYRWITEHVGFVGAGRFSFAAPLPMPVTEQLLQLVIYRLVAMATAAQVPVGIENLATCLSVADARDQGRLCSTVLEAVDGIQLLDLHNLWCQSLNTDSDLTGLLDSLPLERVREIHLAGGRTSEGAMTGRSLRRDTHDEVVDPRLLDLLPEVASRCPNLEVVIYERLGTSLADPADHDPYRDDVRRVAALVAELEGCPTPLPAPQSHVEARPRPDREPLRSYQNQLLEFLYAGTNEGLATQTGPNYPFDPDLVSVAGELVQTWGQLRQE